MTHLIQREIRQIVACGQERELPEFQFLDLREACLRGDWEISQPHRMDCHVIYFARQGTGLYRVDSEEYAYSGGMMFPVAKGKVQVHTPSADAEGDLLLFRESYLYGEPGGLEWFFRPGLFDPQRRTCVLRLSRERQEEFSGIMEQMKREQEKKADGMREEILRHLLTIFLRLMEREYRLQYPGSAEAERDLSIFLQFQKTLEKNYRSTRCMHEYAEFLSLTPKGLNRLCSTFVGKSAKRWINERVLLEIQRLLVHTDYPIKRIAAETGFDDPTNLVKFFKRCKGITPVEYRDAALKRG